MFFRLIYNRVAFIYEKCLMVILVIALMVIFNYGFAQQNYFYNTYGNANLEVGRSLKKSNNGTIFIGGSSAGAITAVHCAYWDIDEVPSVMVNNMGDFNSSGNAGYSDKVAGVVSWAGGIEDTLWLENETCPYVAIHDRFDPEVPYKMQIICAANNDYMYGDYLINQFCVGENIYTNLFTYYKGIHVPSMAEGAYYEWLDTTTIQLYRLTLFEIISPLNNIKNAKTPTNSFTITADHSCININLLENKTGYDVEVFDVLGKKLVSTRIRNTKNTIQLPTNFHGPIAVVLQDSKSQEIYSKKIIIR